MQGVVETRHEAVRKRNMACTELTKSVAACPWPIFDREQLVTTGSFYLKVMSGVSASGRLLPVKSTQCASKILCKSLAKLNANDW